MQGDPNHVLLTTGAAGALFIAHSSLLKGRDHVVVVRPNYSCNVETPRAIGMVEVSRLV
jgi:aspartate/methionine/tyrosine aminotransferase